MHFGLIVCSLFGYINSAFSLIPFFLTLLSFVIFLINVTYSVTLKDKKISLKAEISWYKVDFVGCLWINIPEFQASGQKKLLLLINQKMLWILETLKTILYFSIFRYPLRIEEIHSYTNYESVTDTEKELEHLIAEKILIKVDDFYVYGSDLDSVIKRLRGNMYAGRALRIAQKKAKFIAKFPFVRAVGVSGSLSKGYYDNESDIDFFVITEPNKLWLCRTFLMLYKKIFLLNSRKYFCINYFISTSQL